MASRSDAESKSQATVAGSLTRLNRCSAVQYSVADQFIYSANCYCSACRQTTGSTLTPDGTWNGTTRRIGVNARLFDNFEAADWPVTVIDGKNLW